jgi:hypothetical protein
MITARELRNHFSGRANKTPRKSASYRVVNTETGEVIARGSKRDMKRLLKEHKDCNLLTPLCLYFQGIPMTPQGQVKA